MFTLFEDFYNVLKVIYYVIKYKTEPIGFYP